MIPGGINLVILPLAFHIQLVTRRSRLSECDWNATMACHGARLDGEPTVRLDMQRMVSRQCRSAVDNMIQWTVAAVVMATGGAVTGTVPVGTVTDGPDVPEAWYREHR